MALSAEDAYDSCGLPFDDERGLTEPERLLWIRLLSSGLLTDVQAREALEVHRRHDSPLADILLARGVVSPRDYARHLSEISATAYASDAIDTPEFRSDAAFVASFDPAVLVRFLFCPLRRVGDLVVVLAVDPNDRRVAAEVEREHAGVEVVALAATEFDVRRRVDEVFRASLLDKAINGLRDARPDLSASTVFTRAQTRSAQIAGLALVVALAVEPWLALRAVLAVVSLAYVCAALYKLLIGIAALKSVPVRKDGEPGIAAVDLPVYSILVPVYREPEVIPTLLRALSRLDYPAEKLDVLLLFEEADEETIARAKAAGPPAHFRFVQVPASQPLTKPKACNYGLNFCRGEFVTIYDAEDIPEPNQLKLAVAAFRAGGADLICVQAALNYFNNRENYLTRMFTLEYSYWFDFMLPGLDRLGLPIPLGGTSNHFPVKALRALRAWDPFNVTEDADLGIRASVERYRVGVIRSTTYEEANRAVGNWIRQRSRWIKGYMQTWLVHNRRPFHLLRQLGWVRWASYQFFIGGTPAMFLINPLLWTVFIWSLVSPAGAGHQLCGGWTWWLATTSLVLGNAVGILQSMIAVTRRRLYHLLPFAITSPIYWCLHSIAAYMALWQLFRRPFYWEKTTHGLTRVAAAMLLVLLLPYSASAGPWTPKPGHGQLIVTGSIYETSASFDASGTPRHYDADGSFRKIELNPYFELGIAGRLTFVGNLFMSRQRFANTTTSLTGTGQGDSTFGFRYRVTRATRPILASIETSATLPTGARGGSLRIAEGRSDARLGMAVGGSIGRGPQPAFWSTTATYRSRSGPGADEAIVNASAGLNATSRLMLVAEAAVTRGLRNASTSVPDPNPTLTPDYDLSRLQGSMVVRLGTEWRVQGGVFGHVQGRNTGAGCGVLVAIWKAF